VDFLSGTSWDAYYICEVFLLIIKNPDIIKTNTGDFKRCREDVNLIRDLEIQEITLQTVAWVLICFLCILVKPLRWQPRNDNNFKQKEKKRSQEILDLFHQRPRKWCVYACWVTCIQLLATLWIVARQAPLSMGFSRQEYWLPCNPGDLPPGINPTSPAAPTLWADSLLLRHWGSPETE